MSRAPGMTLDRIAEVAGEAAAFALADARGGRRVYVPKTTSPDTELAQIVGVAAAAKMASAFGGIDFLVARRWRWRERIIRLVGAGKSRAEIAESLGCTERAVYAQIQQARDAAEMPPRPRRGYDPDQLTVFVDTR